MTGCSAIIERAKKFEAEDMAKRAVVKKHIEEGYSRLEEYKNASGYEAYEMTRNGKSKTHHKIGEKYLGEGVMEVTRQKIFFYGIAKEECLIYEDKKVVWKLKYKVDGYRNTIDAVNSLKLKVEDVKSKTEIKTETGELTQTRQDTGCIPEIKNIDYKGEKINFEIMHYFIDTIYKIEPVWGPGSEEVYDISEYKKVTGRNPDVIYEIKILKNEEEIAKLVLSDTKYSYNTKIRIGKKPIPNNSILYIKNGVDEELKSFLFKSALMLKLHKEMRYSIQKEFY